MTALLAGGPGGGDSGGGRDEQLLGHPNSRPPGCISFNAVLLGGRLPMGDGFLPLGGGA